MIKGAGYPCSVDEHADVIVPTKALQVLVHKGTLGTMKAIILFVNCSQDRNDCSSLMDGPLMTYNLGLAVEVEVAGSAGKG